MPEDNYTDLALFDLMTQRWRDRVRSTRFYESSSRALISHLLLLWSSKHIHVIHLHSLSSRFIKRTRRIQYHQLFIFWKSKAILLRRQVHFGVCQRLRHIGTIMDVWRCRTSVSRSFCLCQLRSSGYPLWSHVTDPSKYILMSHPLPPGLN